VRKQKNRKKKKKAEMSSEKPQSSSVPFTRIKEIKDVEYSCIHCQVKWKTLPGNSHPMKCDWCSEIVCNGIICEAMHRYEHPPPGCSYSMKAKKQEEEKKESLEYLKKQADALNSIKIPERCKFCFHQNIELVENKCKHCVKHLCIHYVNCTYYHLSRECTLDDIPTEDKPETRSFYWKLLDRKEQGMKRKTNDEIFMDVSEQCQLNKKQKREEDENSASSSSSSSESPFTLPSTVCLCEGNDTICRFCIQKSQIAIGCVVCKCFLGIGVKECSECMSLVCASLKCKMEHSHCASCNDLVKVQIGEIAKHACSSCASAVLCDRGICRKQHQITQHSKVSTCCHELGDWTTSCEDCNGWLCGVEECTKYHEHCAVCKILIVDSGTSNNCYNCKVVMCSEDCYLIHEKIAGKLHKRLRKERLKKNYEHRLAAEKEKKEEEEEKVQPLQDRIDTVIEIQPELKTMELDVQSPLVAPSTTAAECKRALLLMGMERIIAIDIDAPRKGYLLDVLVENKDSLSLSPADVIKEEHENVLKQIKLIMTPNIEEIVVLWESYTVFQDNAIINSVEKLFKDNPIPGTNLIFKSSNGFSPRIGSLARILCKKEKMSIFYATVIVYAEECCKKKEEVEGESK